MATPTTVPGDLIVPGDLRLTGSISPLKARSSVLALSELEIFNIPWTAWRVWDALQTNLPGTAASDDLALVGGTFGTNSPSIQSRDLKSAGGAVAGYARCQIELPWEYDDGQTVQIMFHAGMLTTVADSDATLDIQCYETDEERGISADLASAAGVNNMNSLTLADITFTIDSTNLVAGDLLDLRVSISIEDAATGTAVIGCIGAAQLLCDVR